MQTTTRSRPRRTGQLREISKGSRPSCESASKAQWPYWPETAPARASRFDVRRRRQIRGRQKRTQRSGLLRVADAPCWTRWGNTVASTKRKPLPGERPPAIPFQQRPKGHRSPDELRFFPHYKTFVLGKKAHRNLPDQHPAAVP